MNKARRHELKMLKYKKRMKKFRHLKENWNTYSYRSHSCPCSCMFCQQIEDNYNRAKQKQMVLKEIMES